MVGPECRHVANHRAVIQYFHAIAAHAADDRLPHGAAKIGRGHTQQGIDVLAE